MAGSIAPALVFGAMYFGIAMGLMVFAMKMECSSDNMRVAAREAGILGVGMTLVHMLVPFLSFLTSPAQNVMMAFGMSSEWAGWWANSYILMLCSLPLLVFTALRTQRLACKPTVDQRAKFKQELQDKLRALNKGSSGTAGASAANSK